MIIVAVEPGTEIRGETGEIAIVDDTHYVISRKGAVYVTPAVYESIKASRRGRMKATASCRHCMFFYEGKECHRFPPQHLGGAGNYTIQGWPKVTQHQWCGEWKRAPEARKG
jgi:hypothetical protein